MVDIFVDPIIITTPHADTEKDVVLDYLRILFRWLEEALNSPHQWFYAGEATAKLLECGLYPLPDILQYWQNKHQVDINISLISYWVGQFFNSESSLELNLEHSGYLVEPEMDSISIQPVQFADRWYSLLRDEMHVLLAKTGACKHMGSLFACELQIATLALVQAKQEIEISARISASEPDFVWDIDNTFSQTLPLLFTPDDLPPPTDIINLWDKGEDGIRYAINHWYTYDWQSSVQYPFEFRFSPSFFTSIENNELDFEELILMRIVRVAAAIIADKAKGVKSYHLRQLRVSKTGDSKQRTRESDNAKAWRLTVTSEGVGWRMHYWQIPTPGGSVIEFANILKKHDQEEIF